MNKLCPECLSSNLTKAWLNGVEFNCCQDCDSAFLERSESSSKTMFKEDFSAKEQSEPDGASEAAR